jgi:hypothetical protein
MGLTTMQTCMFWTTGGKIRTGGVRREELRLEGCGGVEVQVIAGLVVLTRWRVAVLAVGMGASHGRVGCFR